MRILFEKDTIGSLPHVRLGIDIIGREITLVATEEDGETKEITIIGPHKCHSKKFLKEDSFVKIRGTLCAHYKCKKCGADYFVAANPQPFGV